MQDVRVVVGKTAGRGSTGAEDPGVSMWHVTVTFAGDPVDVDELRRSLQRLTEERPFLVAVRYAADRAEVTYWDEAEDLDDAAALALRLWGEHRGSAGLPEWRAVGLEVLDRDTLRARGGPVLVDACLGEVRPL